jgi:hypothetical protein
MALGAGLLSIGRLTQATRSANGQKYFSSIFQGYNRAYR